MILTAAVAFAAVSSEAPKQKGNYFAKEIIKQLAGDCNEKVIENIANQMVEYLNDLSEAQIVAFFEGFNEGTYYWCEQYGLGEEIADMFIANFYAGVFTEIANSYE